MLSLPFAFRAAGWAGGLLLTAAVAAVEGFTMVRWAGLWLVWWNMNMCSCVPWTPACAFGQLPRCSRRLGQPFPCLQPHAVGWSRICSLCCNQSVAILALCPCLRSTSSLATPSGPAPKPTQTWCGAATARGLCHTSTLLRPADTHAWDAAACPDIERRSRLCCSRPRFDTCTYVQTCIFRRSARCWDGRPPCL